MQKNEKNEKTWENMRKNEKKWKHKNNVVYKEYIIQRSMS